MNLKKKINVWVALIALVAIGGLTAVGVILGQRLGNQQAVAPNAPTSEPQAATGPSTIPLACEALAFTLAETKTPNIGAEWKKTYNEAGDTEITSVAKGQTFTYRISVKNAGTGDATSVKVTDKLDGENQSMLTYVGSDGACSFDSGTRLVSCTVDVPANSSKTVSFKVKLADNASNGTNLVNKATVVFGSQQTDVSLTTPISSVVSCNNACVSDSQCESGLTCISNKCRKSDCSDKDNCTCDVAASTPTPTQKAVVKTPTVAVITPEALPDSGIVSIPGAAAFGGGLLLAVLGILFAL